MQWKRKVTVWVVMITGLILLGWDLYVFLTPPEEDTISEVIALWATEWTVVPFMFGVLMGHFFWPVRTIEVSTSATDTPSSSE